MLEDDFSFWRERVSLQAAPSGGLWRRETPRKKRARCIFIFFFLSFKAFLYSKAKARVKITLKTEAFQWDFPGILALVSCGESEVGKNALR